MHFFYVMKTHRVSLRFTCHRCHILIWCGMVLFNEDNNCTRKGRGLGMMQAMEELVCSRRGLPVLMFPNSQRCCTEGCHSWASLFQLSNSRPEYRCHYLRRWGSLLLQNYTTYSYGFQISCLILSLSVTHSLYQVLLSIFIFKFYHQIIWYRKWVFQIFIFASLNLANFHPSRIVYVLLILITLLR